MAFILVRANVQLDINCIGYFSLIVRTLRRRANHVGSIPLLGGSPLHLYRMRNLLIRPTLEIQVQHLPDPPRFPDFATYRGFLSDCLRDVASNAADPSRKRTYKPITTISSGYDSTACAALCTEIGCTESVTITAGRGPDGRDVDGDSGALIARALDLNVCEFPRDAYRQRPNCPEAEFVATGDFGQEVVMCAFEEAFEQRLVVTGNHGDRIWERLSPDPIQRDVFRRGPDGASLGEFRMRVGFIHLQPAFFGAINFPDVHRISTSPEMAPWALGTGYDRPIARRIAEEKGVDRALFGTNKKAVTVLLSSPGNIEQGMSDSSRESFKRFLAANEHLRDIRKQRRYLRLCRLHARIHRRLRSINAILRRCHLPLHLGSPVPEIYRRHPGSPTFLIHWGIAQISPRYASAAPIPSDVQQPSPNAQARQQTVKN